MANEVEGKLVLTAADRGDVIEAIAGLAGVGGLKVVSRTEHALADAYFDTTGRDLAAARLALRVRTEDSHDRFTLKGEGRVDSGVVSRFELELEWSPEALDSVLEKLRSGGVELDDSGMNVTHGAAAALLSLGLSPASPRSNDRSALGLADESGAVIAELDVDRVVFNPSGLRVRHYEVECEARGRAGAEAIHAVLADLRRRFGGLRPVVYSKLGLAEHLEHLAAEGRLASMLDGDTLRPEAYAAIETVLG